MPGPAKVVKNNVKLTPYIVNKFIFKLQGNFIQATTYPHCEIIAPWQEHNTRIVFLHMGQIEI